MVFTFFYPYPVVSLGEHFRLVLGSALRPRTDHWNHHKIHSTKTKLKFMISANFGAWPRWALDQNAMRVSTYFDLPLIKKSRLNFLLLFVWLIYFLQKIRFSYLTIALLNSFQSVDWPSEDSPTVISGHTLISVTWIWILLKVKV